MVCFVVTAELNALECEQHVVDSRRYNGHRRDCTNRPTAIVKGQGGIRDSILSA